MNSSRMQWLAYACLMIAGCGTEVSREYIKTAPNFFITPPENVGALQVQIFEQISDAGVKAFQASISLKNSADSSGKMWSDLLGNNFSVKVGGKNFPLSLATTTVGQIYSSGSVSLTSADAAAIFGNNISILSSSGASVSSQANMPLALSDATANANAISDRLLAPCKFVSTDPSPSLLWSSQNTENASIQIGSNPKFSASVTDSGSWAPVHDLFKTFYVESEINLADLSGTSTSELIQPLNLIRSTSQSMRVVVPQHLDRSLLVTASIIQNQNIRIRYVGACSN